MAKNYRAKQLIAPCFVALKRISFLAKMHKDIEAARQLRMRRNYLNHWIQRTLNKQMNVESNNFKLMSKHKRAFTALKRHVEQKKKKRAQMVISETHRLNHLVQSVFLTLKSLKKINRKLHQKMLQDQDAADKLFERLMFRRLVSRIQESLVDRVKSDLIM